MAEKGLPAPTPKQGKTKIPVASQATKKAKHFFGSQSSNKTYRLQPRSERTKPTKSTNLFA